MDSVWQPIWLSVQVAFLATLCSCCFAIPLAQFMARHRFHGKSILESIILLPMVLPPTVVGYLLLVLAGTNGLVTRWFDPHFTIAFKYGGLILAASVVSMPMLYMPAKAAFAGVERELEEVARMMGASRLEVIWHVTLPMARRGLISGMILASARAMGEFGATMMVFGWRPNRITLPVAVYTSWMENSDLHDATFAVIALSSLSLGLMMIHNFTAGRKRD